MLAVICSFVQVCFWFKGDPVMKIYVLGAVGILSLTLSNVAEASVTDESLWAQSEYRALQAAKREAAQREAERIRLEEEARHTHVFEANEVLKFVADGADEIKEIKIVLKSGVTERFIAVQPEPAPSVHTPSAKEAESSAKLESPFYNERGGRRPVW